MAGTTSLASPTDLSWTLGDRLRKAREVAGIAVQAMAEHLDVDRRTIRNYEKNATNPSRSALRDWARLTSVSLEWLIGEPEPPVNLADRRSQQGDRDSLCTARFINMDEAASLIAA